MKALTLTQPWATLIAIGAKSVETRGWSTRYRGPLAIHAAKGLNPVGGKSGFAELIAEEPYRTALEGVRRFPFGQVVAVVNLEDCLPGDSLEVDELLETNARAGGWEWAFGSYGEGRVAWITSELRSLAEPVPVTGARQLWDVPPEAVAAIEAQLP